MSHAVQPLIERACSRSRIAARRLLAAGLALAAPAVFAALAPNQPLKVCVVDDFSSAAADAGREAFGGLQIALDPINAAGGIGGRKIEIVRFDGKTDPTLAASFATRCAEDEQALMIIGGSTSAPAMAMIPVSKQYSIPYYILTASTDSMTDPPAPFHFRFGPANRQTSLALADFIATNGFKRVAIINNQTAFGVDGVRATTAELAKKNITPMAPQTYDVSAMDVSPQVTNVREQKPDIILMYSFPADAARVMRTIKQLGLNVPVIPVNVGMMKTTRKLAADAADGSLANTSADISRADVRKFFEVYNSRFEPVEPSYFAVVGHDAATMAARVLATPEVQKAVSSGSLQDVRKAIRDATEKVGNGFKGLQGQQGAAYQFSGTQRHGPTDTGFIVFTQVAEKGTKLVIPDMTKIRPKP